MQSGLVPLFLCKKYLLQVPTWSRYLLFEEQRQWSQLQTIPPYKIGSCTGKKPAIKMRLIIKLKFAQSFVIITNVSKLIPEIAVIFTESACTISTRFLYRIGYQTTSKKD